MDFQTLTLLYRYSREFSHDRLRGMELTDTEYMICSYIYARPGCSQDEVSNALRADKTTVGKALAVLENKGCVSRETDSSDKRRKCLRVTDTWSKRIADLTKVHNDRLNQILSCLTEEERVQFGSLCERLLTAADELTKKQKEEEKRNES